VLPTADARRWRLRLLSPLLSGGIVTVTRRGRRSPVMRRARHPNSGPQPQAAVTRLLASGGGGSAAAIQRGTAVCSR
jgi:hypothetical protein